MYYKRRKNYKPLLFLILALSAILLMGVLIFRDKTTNFQINGGSANALLSAQLDPNQNIGPQKPLANPPKIIKAVYATGYSAGSEKKLSYLIRLIKESEINAVVIDIKDFAGVINYKSEAPLVLEYGTAENRIPKINKVIKRLHDEGIYIIGRIAVFEDQRLPLLRPDLALQSKSTGKLWKNYKGLTWLDTASKAVWDYNIEIAKDALSRGFDEINFDYIRFTSDGNLADIKYPVWDGKTPKREVIRQFFAYLRDALPEAKLSADLFGMVTTNKDDLGIGQTLEDALPYFDAIAPMVYPSHYIKGFIGIQNPALYPYEVVKYSMTEAIKKIAKYEAKRETILASASIAQNVGQIQVPPPVRAKLRPWLQDFNIGATYDAEKVQKQIKAVSDAVWSCVPRVKDAPLTIKTCDDKIHNELLGGIVGGWMLWNPRNIYTEEALMIE